MSEDATGRNSNAGVVFPPSGGVVPSPDTETAATPQKYNYFRHYKIDIGRETREQTDCAEIVRKFPNILDTSEGVKNMFKDFFLKKKDQTHVHDLSM